GPAMLRHDRDDLGMAKKNLPNSINNRHPGFQRYGRRHGGADPQIAFLEGGQEFASEFEETDDAGSDQEGPADRNRYLSVAERPAEGRGGDRAESGDHDGFEFADMPRQQ